MTNKKKRRGTTPGGARKSPAARSNRAARDTLRKPTKQERWDAERRAKRRRTIIRRSAAFVVVMVVAGTVATWQIGKRRAETRAIAAMTTASCRFDRKSDPGRVNEHADRVSYAVEPPAGGVHLPTAAPPGTYDAGGVPADGQLVHAGEHGDIVVWHRSLPEDELADLRSLVDQRPDDVLLVERSGLPVAVAATAWHKRLLCEDVEAAALRRFIGRYADKGPERVPE